MKVALAHDSEEARRVAQLIDAAITVDEGGIIAKKAPWLRDLLENPQVHQAIGWVFVIFVRAFACFDCDCR